MILDLAIFKVFDCLVSLRNVVHGSNRFFFLWRIVKVFVFFALSFYATLLLPAVVKDLKDTKRPRDSKDGKADSKNDGNSFHPVDASFVGRVPIVELKVFDS